MRPLTEASPSKTGEGVEDMPVNSLSPQCSGFHPHPASCADNSCAVGHLLVLRTSVIRFTVSPNVLRNTHYSSCQHPHISAGVQYGVSRTPFGQAAHRLAPVHSALITLRACTLIHRASTPPPSMGRGKGRPHGPSTCLNPFRPPFRKGRDFLPVHVYELL